MVQMVNLVGPLLTNLVPLHGPDVPYFSVKKPALLSWPNGMGADLMEDERTVVEYASVVHILGRGRRDVFLAYTEDVETLLGIPIRAILTENDCMSKSLEAIKDKCFAYQGKFHRITQMMTVWQRLKFLFTNDLTDVLK